MQARRSQERRGLDRAFEMRTGLEGGAQIVGQKLSEFGSEFGGRKVR